MKTFFHLILICILPFCSSGQLILGGNNLQETILQSLAGSAVTISNITYQGAPEAVAYFSANTNNMSITSGLLMTTGSKYSALGPNDEAKAGVDNGYPGNSHPSFLSLFPTSTYQNCARIDFDLVPKGNTLKIKYQFGSEEYPESVGSSLVDAFAIYVMGEGVYNENIARIGPNSYITTNNINNGNPNGINGSVPASNPSYFIENGNGNNAPYNSSDSYLQYDGFTVPLIATTHVHPGFTYHIIILIADGGDASFDSGVFIEEGGITASIDENSLDNFVNVFYNSETQKATIEITEHQDNLTYSVVDLSGKTIVNSPITETTTLDLSNYSSGMYLITVESTNGKISKKIIR